MSELWLPESYREAPPPTPTQPEIITRLTNVAIVGEQATIEGSVGEQAFRVTIPVERFNTLGPDDMPALLLAEGEPL